MNINIQNGDCLELMKNIPDGSVDLIFCDPPYALGSEVIIKPDGKPEYKKAVDFMNKWDQPDGAFWEEWFIEAKRVLKYGGHCLMFGMDRQLWFNCYYANLSGFTQKQSLYWYFISNFPKASDLSKNLDKYFGAEREVVSQRKVSVSNNTFNSSKEIEEGFSVSAITAPSTTLAKKYEGIKYSVAPLKQTNETIMVFQKPYKTGSCLHDVLAMENGDDTITCGGVDIDGNRVATNDDTIRKNHKAGIWSKEDLEHLTGSTSGRFPAQTYIDSGASEIIDLQSGVSKSQVGKRNPNGKYHGVNSEVYGEFKPEPEKLSGFTDTVGASRILHKCDFEAGDYDLYYYAPKVSKSERNEGLEGFEDVSVKSWHFKCEKCGKTYSEQAYKSGCHCETPEVKEWTGTSKNNHPTVKPKALLSKILKLFKTPNDQILLDPFMGSGSMGISAVETGFGYIGFELDPKYFQIAEARIDQAQTQKDLILI